MGVVKTKLTTKSTTKSTKSAITEPVKSSMSPKHSSSYSQTSTKKIHSSMMDISTCKSILTHYKFIIPLSHEELEKPIDNNIYDGIKGAIKTQTFKELNNYVYSKLEFSPTVLCVFLEPKSTLRNTTEIKSNMRNKQYIFTSQDNVFKCFRNMLPDHLSVSDKAILLFLYNNSSMHMPRDYEPINLVKLTPISDKLPTIAEGGKSGNKRTNKREHKNRRTRKTRK